MKITDAQLKQIYAHAKETYPYECCGFLIGDFGAGWVRMVRRATNQNQERTDRYLISPEEYGQAQFEAEEVGFDVIGFYHSHPDYPPIPSQTDMEESAAWDYFYLIVSIHEGMPLNTNVWRIADDENPRRFEWVALEIVDQAELTEDE